MKKILLLEDNAQDADLISREIKNRWPDVNLVMVNRIEEARKCFECNTDVDVALFDLKLPDGNGLDLLIKLREEHNETPIIILTAKGSEEIATASLKAGANDYISKKSDFHKRIPNQIEFTITHSRQSQQDISVLYVEHHQIDVDLTLNHLKKYAPYIHLTAVSLAEEALSLLPANANESSNYEVLLLDYRLPRLNAIEMSKLILQERGLDIAIVIVTGQGDENIAVEAMKIGVDDYIVKHENYLLRLPSVLTNAFHRRELELQQKWLKQSETKYKQLFEDDLSGNFITTLDGTILLCNQTLCRILGFSSLDELTNQNITSFYKDPKSRVEFLNLIREKKKAIQYEQEFLLRDGRLISVLLNIVGEFDEKDNLIQLKGQLIDNTERKRNQEHLIKLNNAVQNTHDVIILTDTAGIITFVNPEFTRMYGYASEEVVGKLTPKILKSDFHKSEYYKRFWHNLLNKQSNPEIHFINTCKDGSLIHVEAAVDPIIDENGEIIGYLGIQRDITERKRAEQIQQVILNISNTSQLAEDLEELMHIIQKELGQLMDTKNFFVALYDEETDRIRLPYFQDEMDDIAEFPAGKTITGQVIKQGKALLIDAVKAKKLEAEGKIEKIGLDSASWLGVPLKIKGKVTGAFVVQSYSDPKAYTEKDKEVLEIVSHQISISIERKRHEEQLLEALAAAKESDRIKTAFLANMSHELRTPLNAVIGFSSLIDENTDPIDGLNYAQHILNSGNNLLAIVDEIFEITLLEQEALSLNRISMPLSSFLNEIYQTILHRQKNLGETKVNIELEITGIDQNTIVFTDFNKLKQIFLSVLGNALKFTHEGYIRFGVTVSKEDNHILFFVKDTGIGIPKDKYKSIFEKFIIVDETLTRKYSGIGVGLYISKKLITLLGGEIWLESEEENPAVGKAGGTTFYFTIPR